MKNVRLDLTESEKIAQTMLGENNDYSNFNLNYDINNMIEKEKANTFNNQVDAYAEKLEEQKKAVEEYQEGLNDIIEKMEIKPLFNRILVKPFAANPFQRIKIENGIITDIGGMNPNIEFDSQTGNYVERDQNIIVATVVEVGPDVKYIKEGDTVFYLRNIPTPVPFFRQGFWTLKEENVMAIVNEGLSQRFENLK